MAAFPAAGFLLGCHRFLLYRGLLPWSGSLAEMGAVQPGLWKIQGDLDDCSSGFWLLAWLSPVLAQPETSSLAWAAGTGPGHSFEMLLALGQV